MLTSPDRPEACSITQLYSITMFALQKIAIELVAYTSSSFILTSLVAISVL